MIRFDLYVRNEKCILIPSDSRVVNMFMELGHFVGIEIVIQIP